MDAVLEILKQLGIDSSVFIQFAIFVVLFLILKELFFKKLQFVIELREDKTSKLEEKATHKLNEAQVIAEEYKAKVETAHAVAHTALTEKKKTALNDQSEKLKEAEAKLNKMIEEEQAKYSVEIDKKKQEVMKDVNKLADQLVDKLTK